MPNEQTENPAHQDMGLMKTSVELQTVIPPWRVMLDNHLSPEIEIRRAHKHNVLALKAYLLRPEHIELHTETIPFPATWWQQFKHRYFSEWLKERFPVRFIDHRFQFEKFIRVCPHSDIEFSGNTCHLAFMRGESATESVPEEYLDIEWLGKVRTAVNQVDRAFADLPLKDAVLGALHAATRYIGGTESQPLQADRKATTE